MAYDPIQGVIVSLEKLDAKLDKRLDEQDGKIDSIAISIQRLVAVDIEIRELKDSNKRLWKRMEGVEARQMETGCPTFQKFVSSHDGELKHNVAKIDDHETRLKAVELIPMTRVETIARGFFIALGGGIFAWVLAHWKGN